MPAQLKTYRTIHRDLRIDFFRGLALLIILVNHIEFITHVSWFSSYNLHAIGPADAFDVFIFLSGYVFGIVYTKAWALHGYWGCQLKAFRRAWQLHIAHFGMYLFTLAAFFFLSLERTSIQGLMQFNEALSAPLSMSVKAFVLIYQPLVIDILPLYIVILLIMPSLLCLMLNNKAYIAVVLSYLAYAATQLFPLFPLGSGGTGWIFNPISWQFLFTIAMALAVQNRNKSTKILNGNFVLGISVVFIVVVSTVYVQNETDWRYSMEGILPWTNKRTLGPLRLIYFLCLIRVATFCFPAAANFWQTKLAKPLVICGQNSLAVYCLGILLTYSCVVAHKLRGLNDLQVLFAELGAIGCSLAFAYGITMFKRKRTATKHENNSINFLAR